MRWLPIALKAPWNPTGAQLKRICHLDAMDDGRTTVYTIPPGSLIVFHDTPSHELRWIEVIPPDPDYLIAYDTGAR